MKYDADHKKHEQVNEPCEVVDGCRERCQLVVRDVSAGKEQEPTQVRLASRGTGGRRTGPNTGLTLEPDPDPFLDLPS